MAYQLEDHDHYEYCVYCLKRSCRGSCWQALARTPPGLCELLEEEYQATKTKPKPKPLRLTGWKPPERKKAS